MSSKKTSRKNPVFDMADAPKDGTWIFGFTYGFESGCRIRYMTPERWVEEEGWGDLDDFYEGWFDYQDEEFYKPYGWIPAPNTAMRIVDTISL